MVLAVSNGWGRGGVVWANRVAPGAGTALSLLLGGEPSSGIFSTGFAISRGSVGTGAGKTGGAG